VNTKQREKILTVGDVADDGCLQHEGQEGKSQEFFYIYCLNMCILTLYWLNVIVTWNHVVILCAH